MRRNLLFELWALAFSAVFALGFFACGDDDDRPPTGPCTPGQNQPCSCQDMAGAQGTQECLQDGTWSPCVCGTGGTGGPAPAGGTGGAGTGGAGTGGAGTGGTGGAGTGGTGGLGDAGPRDGGGTGGVAGDEDAGADDAGPGPGGAGGTGAPDAQAPDAAGDGDAAEPDAAAEAGSAEGAYGQCDGDGACTGEYDICYRPGGEPSAATPGFCTRACEASGPACAEPSDGTAAAACSGTSNQCILDCESGTCPSGMTCEDFTVAQVCSYSGT